MHSYVLTNDEKEEVVQGHPPLFISLLGYSPLFLSYSSGKQHSHDHELRV